MKIAAVSARTIARPAEPENPVSQARRWALGGTNSPVQPAHRQFGPQGRDALGRRRAQPEAGVIACPAIGDAGLERGGRVPIRRRVDEAEPAIGVHRFRRSENAVQ